MKKNSLILILIIIIVVLISYIICDKLIVNTKIKNQFEEDTIKVIDSINLDYVNIYLTSDGISYISPLNNEEINKLNVGNNLKERLNTLYERSFYYDVYINNHKLKGFKVKLDNDIIKIRKIEIDGFIYIIFIKENNTIGLFNYDEYFNLLYTNTIDNFNNYENIKDIIDNKIIYLNNNKEDFKL